MTLLRWLSLSLALLMTGCVSVGVKCRSSGVDAWAQVKRPGWGISKNQVQNLSQFRKEVCP